MSADTSYTARTARPALAPATLLWGIALIGLAALYVYLSARMHAETLSAEAYAGAYVYGTLLQALFAGVIIATAFGIGTFERVGVEWLLIGMGVAMYAFGDLVWMQLELILEVDPYPSVADVFYTLEYGFFFAAMVVAIRSYRELTDIRRPSLAGAAIGAMAFVAVWMLVLRPYILPAGPGELGTWGFVVSTLYPVADVFLMIAPAATLALVVRRLGSGRLSWPWTIVVIAAIVFALADTAYSYADWSGAGTTVLTDVGWTVANLLFALAALVARDVYRPHEARHAMAPIS